MRDRISLMAGVITSEVTDLGVIKVVVEGQDRELRSRILDLGKRAMLPIHVFYKMPDGAIVGEHNEWVQDYYKPIHVQGFAGSAVEAPPEEVAKEVKGALKLRRVRSKRRGRPVVAWRLGDQELRAGSSVKFSKETALQWNMGKTLTVKPGATATVGELSTRRPIVFVKIGEYDGVELPVHMMNHSYTVNGVKLESIDEVKKKVKAGPPDHTDDTMMPSQINRLMNAIGFGRNPDFDNVPVNQPFDKDGWIVRAKDTIDDDVEEEEVSFSEARDIEDDMCGLVPKKGKTASKVLLLGKK